MDVRSQISMVFHLDKCIGCHTCSIACKNIWTDRKGTEYMWWNNVETKPGTGYPTQWENQEKYRGGWEEQRRPAAALDRQGPGRGEHLPQPVDAQPGRLLRAVDLRLPEPVQRPEGDDQPTARPISMIDGKYIDIEAGPNWDDDLSGSPVYAENDPNLDALTAEQKGADVRHRAPGVLLLPAHLQPLPEPGLRRLLPSGALYKRGEDGIVLIDQKVCRAWRSCVSACPYKKTYFNWQTGKSEKCILCFPRLETGQAPACFHSCVGGSATSGCCSTTPTASKRSPRFRTTSWSRPTAR